MEGVNAYELVQMHGKSLIGTKVNTVAYGEYPGGVATITELYPDPEGAPEIVMQVMHPTFGEIGVFDYEPVRPEK